MQLSRAGKFWLHSPDSGYIYRPYITEEQEIEKKPSRLSESSAENTYHLLRALRNKSQREQTRRPLRRHFDNYKEGTIRNTQHHLVSSLNVYQAPFLFFPPSSPSSSSSTQGADSKRVKYTETTDFQCVKRTRTMFAATRCIRGWLASMSGSPRTTNVDIYCKGPTAHTMHQDKKIDFVIIYLRTTDTP